MGIGLSKGAGKGSNVYDVIVGTRTLPIVEKPLPAACGPGAVNDGGSVGKEDPGDVDDGSSGGEENWDGKGRDPTLPAGGQVADERELRLRASRLPRMVNKEHSVERENARNMVGEEGRSRKKARASVRRFYMQEWDPSRTRKCTQSAVAASERPIILRSMQTRPPLVSGIENSRSDDGVLRQPMLVGHHASCPFRNRLRHQMTMSASSLPISNMRRRRAAALSIVGDCFTRVLPHV